MPESVIIETLRYHQLFAFLLFLPPSLALIFLYRTSSFPHLIRKIKLLTPAYGFLLASAILTGIIMSFMFVHFSFNALFMSIASIIIIINEIRRYKRQRVIASYDSAEQVIFIRWAKRKYGLDLLLLAIVWIVSL